MNEDHQYDIISIGGSTVDLFVELAGEGAAVECDEVSEECVLSLSYPDKIAVKSQQKILGAGNAANFIVGASRLGLRSAISTTVGEDIDGEQIIQTLKREGVSSEFIKQEGRQGTNVVISYEGDRTILSYHQPRSYELSDLPSVPWVYFTSVSREHEVLHDLVPQYVRANTAKLVFNPGSRQMQEGMKGMQPIIEACFALILNRAEARELVGREQEPSSLLEALQRHGPEVVAITDGERGVYAAHGRERYFLAPPEVECRDRTGAGDSFASGFVASLAHGEDVPTAMRWGVLNASATIQKVGAHNGLLTEEHLRKRMAEAGLVIHTI